MLYRRGDLKGGLWCQRNKTAEETDELDGIVPDFY